MELLEEICIEQWRLYWGSLRVRVYNTIDSTKMPRGGGLKITADPQRDRECWKQKQDHHSNGSCLLSHMLTLYCVLASSSSYTKKTEINFSSHGSPLSLFFSVDWVLLAGKQQQRSISSFLPFFCPIINNWETRERLDWSSSILCITTFLML